MIIVLYTANDFQKFTHDTLYYPFYCRKENIWLLTTSEHCYSDPNEISFCSKENYQDALSYKFTRVLCIIVVRK